MLSCAASKRLARKWWVSRALCYLLLICKGCIQDHLFNYGNLAKLQNGKFQNEHALFDFVCLFFRRLMCGFFRRLMCGVLFASVMWLRCCIK